MKRITTCTIISIAFLLMAFVRKPQPPVKVYLIGDSTVSVYKPTEFPINGWGMPFANYFDKGVIIDNRAKPGRSTRTFLNEHLWQPIADSLKAGDYVLIQFGHNDEGDTVRNKDRRATIPQYRENLLKFINDTKTKGANPILITPVGRRNFDPNGQIKESHPGYTDAMLAVAKESGTPVIDLDRISQAYFQQLGLEKSKLLFMQLDSAEHPNYPLGRFDNTHFNEYGARKIAQMVLHGLQEQHIALADHIVKGTNKSNVNPNAK